MKRIPALALTLFLATTTSALAGRDVARDDSSLDAANHALQGRHAVVELRTGELLTGVQEVFIGPESTTWELDGLTHQVSTGEVTRIALAQRSRISKWSRRGLMVGAILGAVGGGYSETDGAFVQPLDASRIAKGALTGAAVGAAAGALAGDKIVYEADDPTSVAGH